MLKITDLLDFKTLSESADLEFKLALGQDGNGKLPKDFWPTYSAMANSRGGYVILGIKEKAGTFIPVGIPNPKKVVTELFDTLNNPSKVNVNLINDKNVQVVLIENKSILIIRVPAANRLQKAIFLQNNPSWL